MDLLKYVYSKNLPTSLHALLGLLVIADKYEVASCLRDCIRSLQNMPMTCESASFYLDLPPSLPTFPTVQSLIDAAKHFLVAHFKDFDSRKDEILNLSLAAIQVILSSGDLQVTSEGVVYDSVLKWVRKHYPNVTKRREILKTHLLDLVRFPFMTVQQLTTQVQTCHDIYPELASGIVIRALIFKADASYQNHTDEGNIVSHQFVERAYKYPPIKVVEFKSPHQHFTVFLHLTRKELISRLGQIMSETFHLGKHGLSFDVRRCLDKKTDAYYFWLGLKAVGSTETFPFSVKYEIEVRKKPSEKFENLKEGRKTFTEQVRHEKFFSRWWTSFIGDDSTYFINDVLHLRAVLAIE